MDIVERLRDGCECKFADADCLAENACRECMEAADEIERLRTGNRLHLELAEIQNAEIERLRMQVFFAAGYISTLPEFADKRPDEVLKFIQKSSPFQQKETE